MRYELTVQIRFCDLDGLGHINNANYLSYVELARTRFYADLQLGSALDSGDPINMILARTEVDYLAQAGLIPEIRCVAWMERIGTKSFTQVYELTHPKDRSLVYAKIKAVMVWFDYKQNQSIPLPADVRDKLQQYLETGT